MPEQPDDPLHYDMKIPPEPDPKKQHGPKQPPSDQTQDENQSESSSAKNTNVVRVNDRPQSVRDEK